MHIKHFIATFALILLLHATRFENNAKIEVRDNKINFSFHKNKFSLPISSAHVTEIYATVHKSALSESYLSEVEIKSGDELIFKADSKCFFFLGFCIGRPAFKVDIPQFQTSYGDWTMDGKISPPITVYKSPINSSFEMTAKFLGRGEKSLRFILSDGRYIDANLSDGFINNACSLCINGDCSQNSFSEEPTKLNFLRIINFFVEAFLAGYLFYWLVIVLNLLPGKRNGNTAPAKFPYKSFAIVIISLHFCVCAYMSRGILASTPHVSDSAIYYRQALLLSRLMTKTAPIPAKPFEAFLSNSSELNGDRIIYKHANSFWPALMAPFMRLGIVDLLNPALSALTAWMIYILATMLFTHSTGLLACLIYSLSPFSIISAGDYMMQTATLALFVSGLVCLLFALKNKLPSFCFIAGVLVAYSFGLRQLCVAALAIPVALVVFGENKGMRIKELMLFLFGAFIVGVIFTLDNYYLTGEWFVPTHKKFHNLSVSFGHLNAGVNWTDANLGSLAQILFGSYIPQLSLGFVTLPLILKVGWKSWVIFLFFPFLVFAHFFLPVHGLHGYGPRFLYESIFALAILAAYGTILALQQSKLPARIIISILLLFYAGQNIYLAIEILPKYRNYNSIISGRVREIRSLAKPNTIFLMNGDYWQTMDQTVSIFDPTFKDIIIINELPDGSHKNILDKYPNWTVYLVDYLGIKRFRGIDKSSP